VYINILFGCVLAVFEASDNYWHDWQ